MSSPEIVVVGSINHDVTAVVDRLPLPGETVLARRHFTSAGGKGANQAVAASRLGRRVAMIGKVGDDAEGHQMIEWLARQGVDTTRVSVEPHVGTGLALITVDADGENEIVVSAGANQYLSPDDVTGGTIPADTAVLLLQLEIPLDTVTAAAAAVRAATRVVLNPAPARHLPDALLAEVDILVPNRGELAALTGGALVESVAELGDLARTLPVPTVIVTLGADGALLVADGAVTRVPAPVVTAVDTVAAGDAFCGALADALVRGHSLPDAVRWAAAAGAVTATRPGAQTSLPTADEVGALLG